jgi:TonB family protein
MRHYSAFVVVLALFASTGVGTAQTPAPVPGAVRVGGAIKAPEKIKTVDPIYPELAKRAHKEGIVILQLLVSPTGTVQEATVLKSEPLLNQAALNAVNQWEYAPTLVSGVPVPVYYTVAVTFSLAKEAAAVEPTAANTSAAPASQPAPATPPTATDRQAGAADQAPLRVGGMIKAPTKVVNVDPVYPPTAVSARVEGVVILELLVAPQGFVQEASFL